MENEEIEILSQDEGDKVPIHRVVVNHKLKKLSTKKRWLSNSDLLIVFGIILIYVMLFMTRHYILSPIEIDNNYNIINHNEKGIIYIPIVGTNDLHGHFFPVINKVKLNSTKIITYKTGGVELIYSYLNILREEFGKKKVLYFDTGDHYFGAYDSKIFEGKNFDDFFNFVGLNGTTLGNNDFNFAREWIEKKIKNADYPFLINNIKDKNVEQKNGILGDNHETSHLYEIDLGHGEKIKIGVIGLTLNKAEDKPFYDVGNKYTWDNLIFQAYETDLELEAQKLRESGASAVLVLTSIGLNCSEYDNETSVLGLYNISSEQSECNKKSILFKLINNIKPDVIDGIIAGDYNNEVHHWVNDIPVISTKDKARYLNIMYLPFKKLRKHKYILIKDKIKIEGPLPLCQKVFQNYKHCETISREEYSKAGELVDYYWHSRRIELEPVFESEFEEYYSEFEKYSDEKIVKIIGFDTKLRVDNSGNSLLGNLMMDAMKNISQADFSISNPGMFKNYILPGSLSHIDIMNMIHESEKLCITEISGKELITIIRNVQIGENSFQATSGLRQTIKIYKNGTKEVTDIKLYSNNGELVPIDLNKTYVMSSNNFILSEPSGEDFKVKEVLAIIQDKFKKNKIKCEKDDLGISLINYFRQKEVINITQEVNTSLPRIVINQEK